MSINFLNRNCQETPSHRDIFGLCDAQDGSRAYTNTDNPATWIATVKNNRNIALIFTAVDKCVLQDHDEIGRGRCDGLLTSEEHIYFVELKNEKGSWVTKAIDQLESTIKFFIENHSIEDFRHKKAFACNKRHNKFQEIDNELNLRFFRTYKVRPDVQAEIIFI